MDFQVNTVSQMKRKAAEDGRLDVLQWMHPLCPKQTNDVCRAAAGNGHLEVLKWAVGEGYPVGDTTCCLAARRGQIRILEWLRLGGRRMGRTVWLEAVSGGHVDVLEWLLCCARVPMREVTFCMRAAKHGRLGALMWLRNHDFPWDIYVCIEAARLGHFDVLRWALENGAPVSDGHRNVTCVSPGEEGHLDLVRSLRKRGARWGSRFCQRVYKRRRYRTLEWALDQGCPWKYDMCSVQGCFAVVLKESSWCGVHRGEAERLLKKRVLPDLADEMLSMIS